MCQGDRHQVYACVCERAYVCVFVYIHVCVYIHIYTHRHALQFSSVAILNMYANKQELIRFLSTGVVTSSSHELQGVLPNKVICVLSQFCFHTPHIHTSEGDSLFLQFCLLFTVTVTPSDLYYVNMGCLQLVSSLKT